MGRGEWSKLNYWSWIVIFLRPYGEPIPSSEKDGSNIYHNDRIALRKNVMEILWEIDHVHAMALEYILPICGSENGLCF